MNKETYQNLNIDMYVQQIKDAGVEDKYANKAGIYAIKVQGQLVYIGKSTNLIVRIASHMKNIQENTEESKSHKYKILKQAYERDIPIEFSVLYYTIEHEPETIEEDIGDAEGHFIRYFKPFFNYQIPKAEDWRKYTINKNAQIVKLEDILQLAEEKYKIK